MLIAKGCNESARHLFPIKHPGCFFSAGPRPAQAPQCPGSLGWHVYCQTKGNGSSRHFCDLPGARRSFRCSILLGLRNRRSRRSITFRNSCRSLDPLYSGILTQSCYSRVKSPCEIRADDPGKGDSHARQAGFPKDRGYISRCKRCPGDIYRERGDRKARRYCGPG